MSRKNLPEFYHDSWWVGFLLVIFDQGNDSVFTDLDWLVSITAKSDNIVYLEHFPKLTGGRVEYKDMSAKKIYPFYASYNGNFIWIEWYHESLIGRWYHFSRCLNGRLPMQLGNVAGWVERYIDKVLNTIIKCL